MQKRKSNRYGQKVNQRDSKNQDAMCQCRCVDERRASIQEMGTKRTEFYQLQVDLELWFSEQNNILESKS